VLAELPAEHALRVEVGHGDLFERAGAAQPVDRLSQFLAHPIPFYAASMSHYAFALWILALLRSVAPHPPVVRGMQPEDPADFDARLGSIALDIASAAEEAPIRSLGPHPRARTAALLVAVASTETGLALDTDIGPCIPSPPTRCDSGKAVSIWQVHVPPEEAAIYFADRRRAALLAIRRLSSSLFVCRHSLGLDALSAYASGDCEHGLPESRRQMGVYIRLYRAFGPPMR
jgi:hypothetical protein